MKDRSMLRRGLLLAPLLSVAIGACDRLTPDDENGVPSGEGLADAASEVARGYDASGTDDADGSFLDAPSGDASDASLPSDEAGPDATTPDASTPDAATPDASTPDASTPDAGAGTCPGSNPSPAPVVTSIGPNPLPTTPSGSVITVVGSSFTPCTIVRILGTSGSWLALPTTYVSPTQLEATWALNGPRAMYRDNSFHAFTPAPGGGESPSVSLHRMPVPEIGSLEPPSIPAGNSAFTLKVWSRTVTPGSGWIADTFDSGATVYFNSTPLTGAVFSCSFGFGIYCAVSVTVPASLVTTAGTATITVVNPGVNPSQPVPFQARRTW